MWDEEFVNLVTDLALRDTAIPPIETQALSDVEWLCPKCKCIVGDCVKVDNFCHNCGQRILFN